MTVIFLIPLSASAISQSDSDRMNVIVQAAGGVQVEGRELRDVRQFAAEIEALERSAGRQFPNEMIVRLACDEARLRGYPKCFTGEMRVLTPKGYVAIKELKVGDKVISWDVKSDKLVINKIQQIHASDKVPYGLLPNLSPEGLQIQTTGTHPFYSVDAQDYEELRRIPANSLLLHIRDCEAKLVPRGDFIFPAGQDTVYSFTLELSPYNFIIEGILVHNKPGHVT